MKTEQSTLSRSLTQLVSVDLLEAARRSDDIPQQWSEVDLATAHMRYLRFFRLLTIAREHALAPTADIDFMWHLHMLRPVAYAADCLRACGRLIDHDGGFGKGPGEADVLHAVFEQTAALWQREYDEPYVRACEGARNCWHDCADRCWHACSDIRSELDETLARLLAVSTGAAVGFDLADGRAGA